MFGGFGQSGEDGELRGRALGYDRFRFFWGFEKRFN